MFAKVVLIGFRRHDALIDALCRQLSIEVIGVESIASTALKLLGALPGELDLVLVNAGASDIKVCDVALDLSRMQCNSGIIFCGVECPRVADTLSVMLLSFGLRGTCLVGLAPDVQAVRDAMGELETLRAREHSGACAGPRPGFGVSELRAALTRGDFELYYQPKVRFSDGRLQGVEALLRWRHPQHGLLTPASFLHEMEAGGLVGLLTTEVLQQCLHDVQDWAGIGMHPAVSVNLSPLVLSNRGLADQILDMTRSSGFLPSQLTFEITEYSEIADLGTALYNLLKLRLNGHRLSLDDYGAGHASVLQLSRIPFDELKVDMRLVQGAWRRPHLEPLLEHAVSTAHSLGLSCVAEGIETPQEWEHMRRLGFDLGQGYLIGRPMPASDLPGWCCPALPPGL
jgi:EAL domain-containing protein (putative c-di-GMP-specific phosphodiesterase class I)